MKATFYNKNTPLAVVEIEQRRIIKIVKVLNNEMLPFILQDNLNTGTLNKWLQKRLMPEKREGLREVRMRFRGFEKNKHLNGLSDQYWFRTRYETWDDINYFTNVYSPDIGNMFFTPWLVPKDFKNNSPDLVTNGALRKRWVQNEDLSSNLLKTASRAYHQEPLSEVMASVVAKKTNLVPYVEYTLAVSGMILCSSCRNFITQDTELVPAYELYLKKEKSRDDTAFTHLVRLSEQYQIPDVEDFMKGMITLDGITGNTDRHLGNFGFLRDVNTGKFIGPAPLFDNGTAFWCFNERPNFAKKSRLFGREENCLLPTIKGLYTGIYDDPAFAEFIDKYPLITEERKDILRDGIKNRSAILERSHKVHKLELER